MFKIVWKQNRFENASTVTELVAAVSHWDSLHWGQLARIVIPCWRTYPIQSRERISISILDFLLDFVAVCVCVCVRRLFVSIKLIDAHFSNLTKRSEKSISDKTFAGCFCLCRCTHTPTAHPPPPVLSSVSKSVRFYPPPPHCQHLF